MKYITSDPIKGTIVINKEDEPIFWHFCKEYQIGYKQIALNVDGSLRMEITALTVMDILSLGEQIGIYSMTRKMKTVTQ